MIFRIYGYFFALGVAEGRRVLLTSGISAFNPQMMKANSFFEQQQKPEMRRLLAAQKQAYIEGKRIFTSAFLLTLASALIFPIAAVIFSAYASLLDLLRR